MPPAGEPSHNGKQPGYTPPPEVAEPEYPGLLAGIVMVFLGWNVTVNYGLSLLWAATGFDEDYLATLAVLATSCFFAYVCYTIQPARGVQKYFALQPVSWQAVIRIPIFYFAFFLMLPSVRGLVYQALALIGLARSDLSGPPHLEGVPFLADLLSLLVSAPIGEELIMRGLVLQGLLQRYGPVSAVVLSSTIFGVFHGNTVQAINTFMGGCVLGWVFVETRSLRVTILMHACHNGFVVLKHEVLTLYTSPHSEPSRYPVFPGHHDGWLLDLIFYLGYLFLSGAVCWWLFSSSYKAFRNEINKAGPAVASGPLDVLPTTLALADFKARRATKASDSG